MHTSQKQPSLLYIPKVIKAVDTEGHIINVEVQIPHQRAYDQRSLYYWARNYQEQLDEKELYSKLQPTICINLISFKLFPQLEQFHNCFILTEKDQSEFKLTDHLKIHFIELPKLKLTKDRSFSDRLNMWCYYLGMEGYLEEEDMITLLKDDDLFKRAHQEYTHFTMDDEKLIEAEAREKFIRDYNNRMAEAEDIGMEKGLKQGIAQGIEQGIEQGMEKAKIQMAKALLAKDVPMETISSATGMSIDELKPL